MVLDKLLKGRKEKVESTAKTELLHSRLTRQAVKRPTTINGTKAAKHQNATFCATSTLLSSENPEKLAMIPLRADPNAIDTRMKVGIDADAWARSASETLAMMRLDTKLQDMPKPMPIMLESRPINQSGPEGIA